MSHEPERIDEFEVQHAENVTVIQEEPARRWPFGYPLLWLLVVLSLIMNAVMLRYLMLSRVATRQAIGDAIEVIDNLGSQRFTHTVVIDDTIALQADMPVNETIPVTIDQDLAIREDITVPVDTRLFGTINLNVPIDATVPVEFEQDIVIDQTFKIDTTVPIYLEVPINLAVADTELAATLNDLSLRLEEMQASLDRPLIPLPGGTQ